MHQQHPLWSLCLSECTGREMRYKVTQKGQSAVKGLSSNTIGLLMDLMINNINTAIVLLMTMDISDLLWLKEYKL